ncbi:Cna B-type domain-containing protein [Methanobrevibacter sp.]|uniref:Cna B-type domain-containing protein n=1 Tax=Methanobrevibacter sp. TaxID=66852 RepID=UPI0038661363
MNKKIFAIILVSIFLLSAISFVSAETSDSGNSASHPISVKIKWNDNANADARPDSITITLMKNGEIIGTKILNESNSWKTAFNATEDGNFSIKQVTNLSDYTLSINDSSNDEIEITSTLKGSASGEPQENDSANSNTLAAIVIEESVADTNDSSNETNPTNNTTDNNATNNTTDNNATNNNTANNTTDNNATNNTTDNNATNNSTANNTTDNNATNNTTINNDVSKDTPKPVPKKEDNRPTELMKVGIPIIILLIAIFVAVILKR